jgi:hypothetical protein
MDNLPCHKVAGIQEAIKNCVARLLYLPSCSPDLNPIEQAFAKSRRCCEKQPSGHAMVSGMPLPTPSNSTVQLKDPLILYNGKGFGDHTRLL